MSEFKSYIGCKIIKATPMTLRELNEHHVQVIPATAGNDGYMVIYPDGYESWSPKEVFEAAYREVTEAEKAIIR